MLFVKALFCDAARVKLPNREFLRVTSGWTRCIHHATSNVQRVIIPCRGAGELSVDIYHARKHLSTPRILLYIPPAASPDRQFLDLSRNVDNEYRSSVDVATQLRDAATATVVRVNYRLGPLDNNTSPEEPEPHHVWPTPIHDVTTSLDWVNANLVPTEDSRNSTDPVKVGVYGILNGGSLAVTLAMTECRLGEPTRIGAVATQDAILDWACVPDTVLKQSLSRLKRTLFPLPTTHPGAPFDPFASPIHFLRTPLHAVPLTAAQQAVKDAEELGEAFKDMETLDDVIAQEAWVEDGTSATDFNNELQNAGLVEEAIDGLIDNFTTLQTIDEEESQANARLHEEQADGEALLDEWDERRLKEEYALATHHMTLADAMRQRSPTAIPASAIAEPADTKKTDKKLRPKKVSKSPVPKNTGDLVMRHRKWPPSTPMLSIPHFRLSVSATGGTTPEQTWMKAMLSSQNDEMARLLRRAVIRDALAGVKDDLPVQNSLSGQCGNKAGDRDGQDPVENEDSDIGRANNAAQRQIQFLSDMAYKDSLRRAGDLHLDSVGIWFQTVLWPDDTLT